MFSPRFTLTVVVSADGFIARHKGDAPHEWASAEEQALFFGDVEAADWSIMGRHTHEAADRADRRRIVFSGAGGGWKRETQLWVSPEGLAPEPLAPLVDAVQPLNRGLILGGTRVHDWFLRHGAIHRVHLTVEPVRFGAGLPLFTGAEGPSVEVLKRLGFGIREMRVLNRTGTRHVVLEPEDA